jgi:hypothetical protein
MKIDGTAASHRRHREGEGDRSGAGPGCKVAIFDRDADKGEGRGESACSAGVTSDEGRGRVRQGAGRAWAGAILVNCAGVANAAPVGRDKEKTQRYPMNQFELCRHQPVGSFRCIAYSAFGRVQSDR